MRVAIMQPYLLPYIGYFQLIAHVDQFVIYDRIKYTKKGWINRNRMLCDGVPVTFTVPLRKEPDHLDIRDRHVAESYEPRTLVAQIEGAYRRAPHFDETMPLARTVLEHTAPSLFDFLAHGLRVTCAHLGIDTPIEVSSEVEPAPPPGQPEPRGQEREFGICAALGATDYENPIGGLDLYESEAFTARGIKLGFLRSTDVVYEQFGTPFEPNLSILDVMMFNDRRRIDEFLRTGFERVPPKD